jgi:hypothetical protein
MGWTIDTPEDAVRDYPKTPDQMLLCLDSTEERERKDIEFESENKRATIVT